MTQKCTASIQYELEFEGDLDGIIEFTESFTGLFLDSHDMGDVVGAWIQYANRVFPTSVSTIRDSRGFEVLNARTVEVRIRRIPGVYAWS